MTCCLFDINETLLDLAGLDSVFFQTFGSSTARSAWFAQTLQNAMTATITGPSISFEEAGQAALTMLAQREQVQLLKPPCVCCQRTPMSSQRLSSCASQGLE